MTAAAVTDFIGFSFSGRATDCVKDRVVIQADLLSRSAGGRSRPACPKRDYSIEGTKERTGAEGGREGKAMVASMHACTYAKRKAGKIPTAELVGCGPRQQIVPSRPILMA